MAFKTRADAHRPEFQLKDKESKQGRQQSSPGQYALGLEAEGTQRHVALE